jgi:hypothetical protein
MSKVIFKMTFKHPNLKTTVSKNVSHVKYIATRSGVDKTLTENDLNRELGKGVEDLNSSDTNYVKYIDERPQSHGLFDELGIADPEAIQEEISNVNSYVWRGIVSLKEEDAIRLGYLKKDQWQDMLRKKMPDMAKEMGIPISNLRWVSAIHMEKGHPHAHIMIWEKEPQKTLGIINNKCLDNIRKLYTDEIFETERFQLLNEKNIMRDLIRDLAEGDISKASKLIKEVAAEGKELQQLLGESEEVGIGPKLHSEEEVELTIKIKILADKLPGKGRVALKFMPEDIKQEVRGIADYILQQPNFAASLERNLKAVEELTRMYTGDNEAINKARDKAYIDIKDRVSQVILKGAVESQRENIFYVDDELSRSAVNFIKNMTRNINLIPEHTQVLTQISIVLTRAGLSDDEVMGYLEEYANNEDIKLSDVYYKAIINSTKDKGLFKNNLESLSSQKKLEYYLATFKIIGYTEEDAFIKVKELISKDSEILDSQFSKLKDEGLLKKSGENYKLTNKGIDEFLKVKELDTVETEIFKVLESTGEATPTATFKELLDNKDIFSYLIDKDPEEFKVGKFDLRVQEEFGDDNRITLAQLESKVYERYTYDIDNINLEKAEQEFDILKNRVEKLNLNGYVSINKNTGEYSFTEEGLEELSNISDKMEFTRYDAITTLSYIDKANNGVLTLTSLDETLNKEIVNQTAKVYYENFKELLDTELIDLTKKYVNVDAEDNLTSTEEGKWLGIGLNKLHKYFYNSKGTITAEKLKKLCMKEFKGQGYEKQYNSILKILENETEKGHIIKEPETDAYKLHPDIAKVNNLLYQIHKEGGVLNRKDLKDILEKNVPNYDAEKQLKYLTRRLDNLKKDGYLEGQEEEYNLTDAGIEKRADLLTPQRDILRRKLAYLERLGLINKTDGAYQATDQYYKYMKSIASSKANKQPRASIYISKDIKAIIDRTQDKVSIGKIERTSNKLANGKYINNDFEKIKTDYVSVREQCKVQDTVSKTVNNLSLSLLVSGVSLDETKNILQNWVTKANSNITPEKLNTVIEDAYKLYSNNNMWGKITIISTSDWKEMFNSLGYKDDDIPQWIYKGQNWQVLNKGIGISSLINDVWKSAWRELEKQRMQNEASAEHMKKSIAKQQAASQNTSAIKEQIKKNKDKSALYQEEELEHE